MNTLYVIQSDAHENGITGHIRINIHHDVFSGHFPGRAVVPGVCMLDMLERALTSHLGVPFQLRHITMMKFISMWLPKENDAANLNVSYQVNGDDLRIKMCTIFAEGKTFFKFKGQFNVSG